VRRRRSSGRDASAAGEARLPPSALGERRRISGSPGSRSMPCSASIAGAAWPSGRSIALTLAALPAAQSNVGALPSRGERVEQRLPAPVSPVRTRSRARTRRQPIDQHHVLDDKLPQHPEALGGSALRRRRRRVP
jgi:hypothetical protein